MHECLIPVPVLRLQELAWGVLEGLQPGPGVQAVTDAAAAALERLGEPGAGPDKGGTAAHGGGQVRGFNVLHLRFEDDWVSHCGRWVAVCLLIKT